MACVFPMQGYSWVAINHFLQLVKEANKNGAHETQESAIRSMQHCKAQTEAYLRKKDAKITAVRSKMSEVVEQNIDNMDLVISRMKHIDTNMSKSEDLQKASAKFAKKSKTVADAAWWQLCKTYAVAWSVVICVLFIVVLFIVYEADPCLFKGCSSGSGSRGSG